jgi:hypothetical protein
VCGGKFYKLLGWKQKAVMEEKKEAIFLTLKAFINQMIAYI